MINNISNNFIVLKRYITEKDYEQINELKELCRVHDNVNLKLELDYRLHVSKENEEVMSEINEFLYYVDNTLVGYMGISSFGQNVAEITGMVHPMHRRKGIFKRLYNLAINESSKRNFDKILLLSDDKSSTGTDFIKSTGAIYDFSEYRMKFTDDYSNYEVKDINLRKALSSESRELGRQNAIYFGDTSGEEIIPEEEKNENWVTYMIELNGTIIGKIKVETEETTAFICGFGILPEFRGKGYGREALKAAIKLVNKNSIYDVDLDVAAGNNKALNLYKSCGFIEQSSMNYYRVQDIK